MASDSGPVKPPESANASMPERRMFKIVALMGMAAYKVIARQSINHRIMAASKMSIAEVSEE